MSETTPTLTPLKRALLALEDMQARLHVAESRGREPIAVIGVGCRLPGGVDGPESFWRLLQEGVDAIGEVPAERWDVSAVYDADPDAPGKAYTRWGGFLSRVDGFDPLLFGVAPREAVDMDPQQRLLLEVSWEALEHAGQAPDRLSGSRTGVFVGICSGDYQRLSPHSHDPAFINAYSASGTAHSIASGRLSYVLGLQGPAVSVDTACSSSLVAFHLACQSLRAGECRMAITGGVHLMLAPNNTILFCKSRMMSPTGRCRTFGAGADGFVLGEGCGVVVLKKLTEALEDRDRILAVVRGTALNQDGPSGGITVPNGPAQEAVIREALEKGGVSPADVGYVETHGTGTSLGDPIEVRALAAALAEGRPAARPVLIGSVKTNMGHLEAAAGVTGLIKAVLAVHHGEIPPHLHAEELSPHIPWDELPVAVARAGARWPEGRRRIAGVSAFGFSGTNAHVVVEEPPFVAAPASTPERPRHILALSARTESALRELARRHAAHLAAHPENPANVAYTVNTGRAHLAHRRALCFGGAEELRAQLEALAAGGEPEGTLGGALEGSDRPRVVFLFTGQGAQYAGMGRMLYETEPRFRRTLDRCQEILRGALDRPLVSAMLEEGALLDQTAYTQPALFAIEYAIADLWRSWGVEPAAVAGHSVGEYVAACVAGVFSLEDGLRLIAARGRLMQALPPGGVMVAAQAEEALVREAMAPFADRVDLAAVNAPTSLVLSGAADAVERVCGRLVEQGVKVKTLPVSHAFHSPLVEPMRGAFEREAAGVAFAAPALPLVSNVTGEAFRADQAPDAAYWSRHVRSPVRFLDSIRWLHGKGYRAFLEIGPSPTLSGLGPLCVADPSCLWLPSLRKGRDDWGTLLGSLASLYVRGAQVDWRGFDRDYERRTITLPTYPFERERYWFAAPPLRTSRPAISAEEHPLLGRRLRAATMSDVVFEQEIDPSAPAFLQDHRVHDVIVFPAVAYLEMGLAAGTVVAGGRVTLEDVTIREPLVLSEDAPRTVQTVVTGDDAGRTFRVFSRDLRDPDAWRLHAEGRVVRAGAVADAWGSLDGLRARCPERRDASTFYAELAQRGLPFGGSFQAVAELLRGEGEAAARVAAPGEVARALSTYRFHPALLDAGLQTLSGALPEGPGAPIFMPIGLGEVQVLGEAEPRLFSHARVQWTPAAESATGEVHLYRESDGGLVARLARIALKRADPEALARAVAGGTRTAGCTYEVAWEEKPLERPGGAAPPPAPQSSLEWLVLADEGGLGDRLAARLDGRVLRVRRGPRFASTEGSLAITIDPESPADWSRMWRTATGAPRIVYLWGLDTAPAAATSPETLRDDERRACGSVLQLVQTVVAAPSATPPRLFLLTRGAQPALDAVVAPAQATLLGLGKAVALEHPALRCTRIDLCPDGQGGEIDALLAELRADDVEGEVALRPAGRLVPRLKPRELTGGAPVTPPCWDLAIAARGELDRLEMRAAQRRSPGAGEVEIEVRAIGLNFRDVLNALGLYPGPPPPFGSECAGRIVAVGKGVQGLEVGDDVIAVAPGAFRSHVTAAGTLVVRKPRALSYEEAATLAVPFVTAWYCLRHVAKLGPGERVLIHAAAGGVGLAAVQIARLVGAEVFATAGSPAKREFLEGLGVTHLMDSRSLAFADQVVAATGGRGVDVVLNSLAGDFVGASVRATAAGGRFVEIGKREIWPPQRMAVARPDVAYSIVDWGETAREDPQLIRGIFDEVVRLVGEGALRPLPRRVFPVQDAATAFRYMAQGRHLGKIVVTTPAAPDREVTIRPDRTYLLTGAFAGLGLLAAEWLRERGARHLALLGRREPDAGARDAVERMRAAGADVRTYVADVSDEGRMGAVMAELRQTRPPLAGVIHAAGTLDDGVLTQLDWPRFAKVLAPKVEGAWILHAATREQPLDFFALYSSVASLLGSSGQANYTAANAFLDALAHHRRACGLPAVSLDWGAWQGVGMAARMRTGERAAQQGVGGMPPREGLAALAGLLGASSAQVGVAVIDWPKLLSRYPAGGAPAFLGSALPVKGAAPGAPRPRASLRHMLEQASPASREHLLRTHIREESRKVLGLSEAQSIDPKRPLHELGLDSLMAVELRNALGNALASTLPATLLFDHPTVDALVAFALREVPGLAASIAEAEAPPEEAASISSADVLSSVENLSEEEVARLLSDKMGGARS